MFFSSTLMKLISIKKGHEYIIKFTAIWKKIYLLFYTKVIFRDYKIFYKISKKKKKLHNTN